LPENAELFLKSLSTASAVTELVGTAENLYFEAKRCSFPLSDTDKNHLAEALSGFANADGGVLIYGLVAKGGDRTTPDVVTSVEPISNASKLESDLLGLVGQVVQPPVENVNVISREFVKIPGSGFVLVYVPSSPGGPHRSLRDREYYRRHGSGFFRMEHYELEEMFGRRMRPELRFWWTYGREQVLQRTGRLDVFVGIENIGRGVARYPALLLADTPVSNFGLDGNGNLGLPMRPLTEGRSHLFGGGADHVIYPGSILQVTTARFEYPASSGFQEFEIKYEIYADGLLPLKGSQVVRNQQKPGNA
jgi:hypothetical protein